MAGLAAVKESFFNLMEAYTRGEVEECGDLFDESSEINYSTVGKHTGRAEIVKALQTRKDFDIHYSTIADIMLFETQTSYLLLAKGHHLQAYRDSAFLFPLLWGGKYEYAVSKATGKVEHIYFYLEYEFGNTYLPKVEWNWKMYEETKELSTSIVKSYHDYQPQQISANRECIQDTIYKLLWDWDNMDEEACLSRVTEDVYVRVKLFEEVGPSKEYYRKEEFRQLMRDNLAYEDQPQFSVMFEDVEISQDGESAIARMKRYNPGKIVNKHVDVSTIHKLFFNMRFVVRMVCRDGCWLLQEANVTPINDVDALSFDFTEVSENKLQSVQSAFYR